MKFHFEIEDPDPRASSIDLHVSVSLRKPREATVESVVSRPRVGFQPNAHEATVLAFPERPS